MGRDMRMPRAWPESTHEANGGGLELRESIRLRRRKAKSLVKASLAMLVGATLAAGLLPGGSAAYAAAAQAPAIDPSTVILDDLHSGGWEDSAGPAAFTNVAAPQTAAIARNVFAPGSVTVVRQDQYAPVGQSP